MSLFSELEQVVTINSDTANKTGVDAVGAFFCSRFAELGYQACRHPRTAIGDHWHHRAPVVPGQKVLLLGHLDTVDPPGSSPSPSFRMDERWVYGPGVCDMKGGIIVMLEALRAVRSAVGGVCNVDVLLVADEETGSGDARNLIRDLAPEYDVCLVFEAAGKGGEVVVGRKGVGTFTLHVTGVAAHAGNDQALGVCANTLAARALLDLIKLADPERQTTLNVGRMQGGIGANTVSPAASLLFELRYARPDEKDRLLRSIDRLVTNPSLAPGRLVLGGGIQRELFEPDARQGRLLAALRVITGDPLPTERRGGVSDANLTHAAGVVTLDGFGPFGEGDHTPRERALKASFVQRIALVARLIEHHQRQGYRLL
ncbi:MAG: M20 family metallopeptidase [Magnetococcales bacterium]|nr:M20 family metallopeptidase [Magnetococcales bacterium]